MRYCGCCVEGENAEDNGKKMEQKHRDERWAWWFSSFSLGPDTANSSFWSVAFTVLAAGDSMCGPNPADGLSSGADGMACTPANLWNETVFTQPQFGAAGGAACLQNVTLGEPTYHNLDTSK